MANASDIATGATWQINCSARAGGSKRLRRLTDADANDGSSVEGVPEVGPGEMVGFMDKPGAVEITLNFRERKLARPEVDWHYLKDAKEEFDLTRQVIGGERRQYLPCRVSTISPKDTDQGEITYTVTVVALGSKPL